MNKRKKDKEDPETSGAGDESNNMSVHVGKNVRTLHSPDSQ